MDNDGLQKLQTDIDIANVAEIGSGSFGTVFKVQLKNSPKSQNVHIKNHDYALKMTIMDSQEEMEHENEGRAYREITKLRDGKHVVQQYSEYSVSGLMDEIGSFLIGNKSLDSWCATATEGSSTASRPDGRKTANESGFVKFFLMELCIRSLHDYVENAKPDLEESEGMCVIDHQEISRIFTHVATGLVELHRKGVIHRDIKPRNILQGSDGNWKIGDFGLCTLDPTKTEGSTVPFDLTMSKSRQKSLGTPMYKAPEIGQMVGGELYSQKVDVFSLGQTYIHLVISHENANARGILLDIIHGEKPAAVAYQRVGSFFNKCAMGKNHLDFVKLLTKRLTTERPSVQEALEVFCNNDVFSVSHEALTESQAPPVAEQEVPSILYCCCQVTTAAKIYGWIDIVLGTIACITLMTMWSIGVTETSNTDTGRTICKIGITYSAAVWIMIVGTSSALIYGVSHKRPKWCLPHIFCRPIVIASCIGLIVAFATSSMDQVAKVVSYAVVLSVMGLLGYQMNTVIKCYKFLKNCAEPHESVIDHYSPALTASYANLDNRDEARIVNGDSNSSYESPGESNTVV